VTLNPQWPLLAIFLFLSTTARGGPADLPDLTYRTTVSEVRLTFFATNGHNQAIRQLQPGDFAIVDDGWVIRDFRSFGPSEIAGLNVVVLLDSSESVASGFRREAAEAIQLIAQTPWIAQDHLSVATFAGAKPGVVCVKTCRELTPNRLLAAPADNATPLFDGIVFAADSLSAHRDENLRPAIILFSDGEDTISRNAAASAIEAALTGDAPIYTVDMNRSPSRSEGSLTLHHLAEATGGAYFSIQDGRVADTLLDNLKSTYVVTYKLPRQAAGRHSVRILPAHDLNLQFHCRQSYYSQGSAR